MTTELLPMHRGDYHCLLVDIVQGAGTKGGEKRIPESLGLAPGVVFLLCIIFFQLLHFYDAAAILDWVSTLQAQVLQAKEITSVCSIFLSSFQASSACSSALGSFHAEMQDTAG